MKTSLFRYELPEKLIAQFPEDRRDASRLLIANAAQGTLADARFADLPTILARTGPRVLLVANDSRVYPARVRVRKSTGARGEVFLLETGEKADYACLLRPKKKLSVGEILYADSEPELVSGHANRPQSTGSDGGSLVPLFRVESLDPPRVSLASGTSLATVFNEYAEMPLPPYIERDPTRLDATRSGGGGGSAPLNKGASQADSPTQRAHRIDKERYQTVYAKSEGSAAAPTAGLHFTPDLMQACARQGVEFAFVTLHVGLGTFAPVQTEDIEEHLMHVEHFSLPAVTCEKILEFMRLGLPIVFVGTTSLRAIESFFRRVLPFEGVETSEHRRARLRALSQAQPHALEAMCAPLVNILQPTDLFIRMASLNEKVWPSVGNALLTNFHQPESTLAILVASLLGYEFWKKAYAHAVFNQYRFLSYGDSSLLWFEEDLT